VSLRILLVKVGGLWPLTLRSFHMLAELSKRHRVTLLITHNSDEDPEALARAIPGYERVEALVTGKPVVGTRIGAEGLPLSPGRALRPGRLTGGVRFGRRVSAPRPRATSRPRHVGPLIGRAALLVGPGVATFENHVRANGGGPSAPLVCAETQPGGEPISPQAAT
jgi:hypothetical protein